MWLGLLGIVVLGLASGGAFLFLRRVLRLPLPRWTVPVAAGAAMLAGHLYIEYGWFGRTAAALPDHIRVAQTYSERNALQPWTFLVPQITRFMAVDIAAIKTNPSVRHLRIADVILVARHFPTAVTQQVIDCQEGRRADATAEITFDEQGRPLDLDWVELSLDDPLVSTVCADA